MENNDNYKIFVGEYNSALHPIKKIEVSKTNGKFAKIGLKVPKLEDPIYGVGRSIALGERDWLINSVLNDKRIIPLSEQGKLVENALIHNMKFIGGVIFIPSKFYMELIQFFYNSLRFENPWSKIYGYDLIPIPDKISDKIIIIENLGIIWKGVTKKEEFLHVDVKGKNYEVYTLNYLDIDPEMVKVIDLKRSA